MISIKKEKSTIQEAVNLAISNATAHTVVDDDDIEKMKSNNQEFASSISTKFYSSYSIESLKRKSPSPPNKMPICAPFSYPLAPQVAYFANHMINSLAHYQQQQQQQMVKKLDVNNNNNNSDHQTSNQANDAENGYLSCSLASGLTCIVCGDISSGKHYGILACNGCSGFFKRSVRRRLVYRCQAGTGTCVIDKAHRNQCQACRLKKCIRMGMNKDAVQNERQPRNSSQVKADSLNEFLKDSSTVSVMHPQESLNSSSDNYDDDDDDNQEATPKKPRKISKKFKKSSDVEQESSNSDEVNIRTLEPIHELSMKMLYMSIKWCKTLPSFISLPLKDQILLLEQTWSEIFLLCALQWSLHQEPNPFAINDSFSELIHKFKQLNIDSSEFAFLKAIVLFRPEIKGLKETVSIEILQDQAQTMLAQYLNANSSSPRACRFGKLLLTIPMLKVFAPKTIECTYFPTKNKDFSMNKFLHDLMRN